MNLLYEMLKSRLKFKTMNIFIIGPMGSGKSTIANMIKSNNDKYIIYSFGGKIKEIAYDLFDMNKNIILSTGGGIILSDNNRELLSSRGTVFFLSTPIYIQVEITSKDKDRPLLKKGDPTKILTKLHKERENLYQSVADYVVDTENKSSQEVASEIVNLVKA